ncbi:MAG: leucyl/phenylalanyl-tRNA--protein transferase [Opitutales bacterium]|nr:leucyl/phenylalanyl-tRNA--protein transferase [Opitutales bacterium]
MPIPRLSSSLSFPDPRGATIDGLLAIGGDLRVERLLEAYERGIFPWYSEGQPILWFSPDPRMVLYPNRYRCPYSLQRLLKSKKFDVRGDSDFAGVIRSCAATPRHGQTGTWITEGMIESYIELHRRGFGHWFDAYLNNQLVGCI